MGFLFNIFAIRQFRYSANTRRNTENDLIPSNRMPQSSSFLKNSDHEQIQKYRLFTRIFLTGKAPGRRSLQGAKTRFGRGIYCLLQTVEDAWLDNDDLLIRLLVLSAPRNHDNKILTIVKIPFAKTSSD